MVLLLCHAVQSVIRKMKIAQIAPLYEAVPPTGYGGTERVVHWLTEELVRRGCDIELFASGDSQTSAHLVPACKRALRCDGRSQDGLAPHVVMIEEVLRRAKQFDVIHSHIDYLPFSQFRLLQLPAVTTLHGRLDMPELVTIFKEFREQAVVSISHAQRAPLAMANWVGNVYHGLPELFRYEEKPDDYVVFVGRICPEKGLDKAINIASRAGLPLKIAAKVDPADRNYFEREIEQLLSEPGVEYLGEAGEGERQALIGKARALLFPIVWPEPFGLVMIEAMACGTPVIAFHQGSVPEIIVHGLNGFICEDTDSAVESLRNIKHIRREECRRLFEQRFTAVRMAQDYLRIYRHIQSEHRGTRTYSFSA